MASYTFVNAYAVNTATTPAAKEQNSVDFSTVALGPAVISDGSGGVNFSGNDVVVRLTIGGVDYYGWISRPIKSGGDVKGFYFWKDSSFADLSGATTDANRDTDGIDSDNSGFVLVVKQAFFDGLTASGGLKNVGTSSDRVDASLNSVLPVNSAPIGVNDSATVLEDGTASTPNVLSNDTDVDSNPLTVTGFSIGGVNGTLGSAFTMAGVGSFTLNATGAYTFTPTGNYSGTVPAITYTLSDGNGGTASARLSLTITPVNDAPAGADRTITANEGQAYTFTAADFGFTDPNDSPAHALHSVTIASLPAAGSLTLNGVAVTGGQSIPAASLGLLRFTPAANASGAGYASFTFQVRDSGGTANSGVDLDPTPNTLTFNISNVNSAPSASADTATAVEAGGVNNATAGTNPTATSASGVLANDTDPDGAITAGTSHTVTAVASGSGGPATITTTGRYGSLALNADGGYTYTVNNSHSEVQALRTSSQTLTDSFTYTVTDAGGLSSQAVLTVTIQGANDSPDAINDSNVAKESIAVSGNYGAGDATGYLAQGNVLNNDTDADSAANGETQTVTGLFGSATGATPSSGGGAPTNTYITLSADPTNAAQLPGKYVYYSNDGGTTKIFLKDASNNFVTVDSYNSTTKVVTLSAVVSTSITGGATLIFTNNTSSGNVAASAVFGSSSTVLPSATVNVSSISDTLAVGMGVTGGSIPANTFVKAYDASAGTITLGDASNNNVQVTLSSGTALTFSSAAGTTLTGRHGTLVLNANGSYTYTPTANNANLSAGQSATETFSYRMADAAGAADTAVLSITVFGSGANDPRPVADTNTAVEASGVNNGTAGTNLNVGSASGVLSNDSDPNGAITIGTTHTVTYAGTTSASAQVTGGGLSITGSYGTLTLTTSGSYTYTVDNSNATVQALRTSSNTVADRFFYRISDGSTTADSTLTITIQGADDTPTAADDTGAATESGGSANAIAGQSASGRVLSNDTDVDTPAGSLAVSAVRVGNVEGAGTAGTLASPLAGSYGSLTMQSDGSWTYAVDEANATVQALASGGTLTDTFNYTVSDGTSSDTAALTVTINGANDAPVNTAPSSATANSWQTLPFTGADQISVSDPESAMAASNPVQLSVSFGTLTVGGAGGTVSGTGTLADPLILSGTLAEINGRLATLAYTPQTGFSGTDTLRMSSTDAGALTDIDVTTITVTPDGRDLTVSGTTVNEASDYVIFTVTGVTGSTGQLVRLSLGGLTATAGTDFLTSLEYHNGTAWTAYTPGSAIAMPAETLMVRAAVLPDSASEGSEMLRLTVLNLSGESFTGDSSIVDDVTGTRYPSTHSPTNNAASTSDLDDDRTLTVSSPLVNEASSHAVFSVGGVAGQVVTLALVSGSATSGTDHGTALEVWDGALWQPYGATAVIPAGGTLLVRTTVGTDNTYEGPETFGLRATNAGGTSTTGTATIVDDGTGLVYNGNVSGAGAPVTSTTGLDNDLSVSVSAAGPVNEASDYAMFTVTATNGAALTLALSATGATPATIGAFSIQYSTDGTTWTTYSANSTPVVPGALGSGTSAVYVRVPLSSEADVIYEGPETFTLTATIGGDGPAPLSGSAQATVIDDGTGTRYDGTITGGAPTPNTSSLDSDKPTVSVSAVTVSEASPYAVVSVSLSKASTTAVSFTPSLVNGSATTGTDTGNTPTGGAIEYFNGTAWVSAAAGVTLAPNATSVLLRTAITNDTTLETSEDFSFSTGTLTGTVTNSAAATGTVTIKDDGSTGNVFLVGNNSATPTAGTADNDSSVVAAALTLSVTTANTTESGTNASFTVVLTTQPTANVVVTVSSADTTEGTVSPGSLTFTAANWNVAQTVTVSRVDDTLDDGDITYAVNLSAASSDTNYQGLTGTVNVTNADNDAPPSVSVSGVTVGEAAGSATVTLTRTGATGGTTTVDWATVAGTATAGADYTAGSGTVTFAPGETSKTVVVTIVDDSVAEGAEALTVQLSNVQDASSSAEAIGTASATVGITDNEIAGLSLSATTRNTAESGTNASFTVVLTTQPTADVVVTVSSADTTEGTVGPGSLTFTAANWNVAQTVTVSRVDDTLDDGDITYAVNLSAASSDTNYQGLTGTVNVTNADDDAPPSVSVSGVTVGEAAGSATVTLTRTGATGGTTTVDWATVAGTATAGADYTAGSGTVTFAPGETSKTVSVSITNDGLVENTESLTVQLSNVQDASSSAEVIGTASATVSITDNDVRPSPPVIVDVTETVTDPTPLDLLTGDVTQVLRVTGTPGLGLVLYTKAGVAVAPSGYSVTEISAGVYEVDARATNLNAGDYVVRHVDVAGNQSVDSNAFTVDSVPELEEKNAARAVIPNVGLSGRLEVIDQNRVNLTPYQSSNPPTLWRDSDGEQAVFGIQGGVVSGNQVSLTLGNGSVLELNRVTGTYTYRKAANAVLDEFPVTVRDPGGRGGNLTLTFEARDLLDRDGVPSGTEDQLARRLTNNPDLNGDGVEDSRQNSVTTMAWVRESYFTQANQGNTGAIPSTSVVTVVANEAATGTQASPIAQLINFSVLPVNRDGSGGLPITALTNASAPWDAISFALEPLQSLGLVDINATRAGLQQRVTIDVSAAGLEAGTFTSYVKWISAATINAAVAAGVELRTLDGVVLNNAAQEGWYDFTRRTADGDGARFVESNGRVVAIELILTDNAFGDVDFTVGRIADPGMPIMGAGITVSGGPLNTSESGSTASFTVVLNAAPTANVTVTLTGLDATEGALSTNTLTFTPGNWNVAQTVVVTGVDDPQVDGSQSYTLVATTSSTDGNYSGVNARTGTVGVSNADNDVAGMTVSGGPLSTTEAGGSGSFTVVLNSAPTANVTVTLSGLDATEGALSTNTLTFTPGNWNVAQTVVVTGVDDPQVDGSQSYTLVATTSSTDGNYSGVNARTGTVGVSNADNDVAGMTVSGGPLSTTEAGGSGSFTVVLNSAPTANVTVTLSGLDATEGALSTNTLTFTPGNWNVAQTVVVTGVDDPQVDGAQSYTLTATTSSAGDANYTGGNARSGTISITNADNDVVAPPPPSAGITVSGGPLNTSESGSTASFTVVLNAAPTANVTVTLTGLDATEGALSTNTLTFTPGNWNVAQTVVVTGVDDPQVDGSQSYTLVATTSSTDGNYSGVNARTGTVGVSNADNDVAGMTVSGGPLSTTEAGGSGSFTVVLNSAPTANVTVTLSGLDATEGALSTNTLTFTPGNWNVAQTVVVTGVDDPQVDGSQSYTLVATTSSTDGNYSGVNARTGTVGVSNADNDVAGMTVSGGPLSTTEAGGSGSFTVVLNSAPTANVTVTLSGLDATEGALSTNTLTFTPGNWNVAQTVVVTGVDDPQVDGAQSYTLTATTSSAGDANYTGGNARSGTISITNADNDVVAPPPPSAGITVSGGPLNTSESGSTASFTVVLNAAPTANVTVTLTGLDATEGALSTNTLTFTPGNWNVAQTVVVTGVDDPQVDGSQSYTLVATTSSTDGNYSGVNARTGTVGVSNADNDVAGMTVSGGPLSTTEAGGSGSFTVVLNSAPTANVTVTLSGLDATEGALSTNTLTFTPGNWNVAQTVVVTGVDDPQVDGSQSYTLVATTSSTDGNYSGVNARTGTVGVSNADNDVAGMTVSGGPLSTTEAGGSGSFTVVLNSAPTANVTVTLSGLDATEGALSTNTLTFTPGNWNVAQTVVVTGVDDPQVDGAQSYTLTATTSSAGDANYTGGNARSGTISITNADNDVVAPPPPSAGITVSGGPLNTSESGSTASFTVVLNAAPTANVTVTLTGLDATEGALSTNTLTFTPGNWNVAQTVVVTGVDDPQVDGSQSYTLVATTSSTDGNYSGVNARTGTVGVSNADNDVAGMTVSGGPLSTTEAGGSGSFTVVLNSAPTANVTVTLSGLDATEGALSTNTLTFTPGNWNVAQTVVVTGVDDPQVDGAQSYTLTATTSSAGDANYTGGNARSGTISITNADNDVVAPPPPSAGITVSGGPLNTSESGSTASFTVVLNAAPTANVTVTLTGLDATEGALSTNTLTFTPGNWNVAQTVVVTGVDDPQVDGSQSYTLVATTSSTDGNYSGVNARTGTVGVSNADDDVQRVAQVRARDAQTTGYSDADVIEGQSMAFDVELTAVALTPITHALRISGTAQTSDLGEITFSDGVSVDSGTGLLTVPAGVTSFTVTVASVDDRQIEDLIETCTLTVGEVAGTGRILDNDVRPSPPVIVDVTETVTDPTPLDLLTGDVTQVLRVTGTPGLGLVLYTKAGVAVAPSGYSVTEISAGVYEVDARATNLNAGDYVVRHVDVAGNQSVDSNAFTVDSVPELEEKNAARAVIPNVGLSGRLEVIDQNRVNLTAFQTTNPPTLWRDSDGEQAVFGIQGGVVSGNQVSLTLGNGSVLELNRVTGTYTYRKAANAVLDEFPVTVRDPGGRGGNLTLTFEARDLLDRDGVPSGTEDQLARRLTNNPDLNGDGVEDSRQNSVTTMAWVRESYFTQANQGNTGAIPSTSVVTVVANEAATGTQASPIAQLINFSVLPVNRDGSGGLPITALTNASAPWDAISFALEPLQSLGLVDINATRAGLQQRVTIDVSAAGLEAGTFTSYVKWISAATINAAVAAGVELRTLDGVVLNNAAQEGWYDFKRRTADGDGARFVESNGRVVAIELILTDNAFGDVDFTVGRFMDPGMPLARPDTKPPQITAPATAAATVQADGLTIPVPENRKPVVRLQADEPVYWSVTGGADATRFTLSPAGELAFVQAPDFESPADRGGDNVYEVVVRAQDPAGNSTERPVRVQVTDVLETVPLTQTVLPSGDRILVPSVTGSPPAAQPTDFLVMPTRVADWVPLVAWRNVLTGDLHYAPEGSTLPYDCYLPEAGGPLGWVPKVGQGAFDVHLWVDARGVTQLAGLQAAAREGLAAQGYVDRGPLFGSGPAPSVDGMGIGMTVGLVGAADTIEGP